MRAQLRTYHAIPSLQAQQDPHAYKQLQDAPRLKSILKGGAEDRAEPQSLEAIKMARVPRTNPVNLLFVICQSAAKIAELHFPPGREFHDLIMKTNLTSHSRAMAFLWIMWFYLESDFTEEGCDENPFGRGVDYGVDVANQGVPKLEEMTAEDEAQENIDTEEEKEFGLAKQKLRTRLVELDQQYVEQSQPKRSGRAGAAGGSKTLTHEESTGSGILPRIRPSKHESDMDSVRSTPPPRALAARHSGAFSGTGGGRRGGGALKSLIFEGSSPAASHGQEGIVARKPRPPTAHQLAVERNRVQRVNAILDRGIRRQHHQLRKIRRSEGSITRAVARLKPIEDPFADSDEEDFLSFGGKPPVVVNNGEQQPLKFVYRERGVGGLSLLTAEDDDFGEEVTAYAAALRRAERRLRRWKHWADDHDEPLGVIRPVKRAKTADELEAATSDVDAEDDEVDGLDASLSKDLVDPAETEDEADLYLRQPQPKARRPRAKTNGARATKGDGDTQMGDAEDLDDVEKGLLGIADEDDDDAGAVNGEDADDIEDEEEPDDNAGGEDNDADLDPLDKTLLGMEDGDDSDLE
jgi:Ino eighty subunit 1